ncbi:hypothetical protein HMPREF0380_01294 [Eubacterium infirmum F0142]|nr:hypothetical protein HMPREF0380_01294 [Eubacterium infirmum F0142]
MKNTNQRMKADQILTYDDALSYIENYTWSKTRPGLSRTYELLEVLGNPQDALKFVHVAGSNGKGSTCAMLSSILSKSGLKTGFYLSPHLSGFCERFQIDGMQISEEDFIDTTRKVAAAADSLDDHPSQFEISTAIAFLYFKTQSCDIVVLEVGMGGSLDSTNVIKAPELAVICNIGLDHTDFLGSTLAEIAENKAGIIKPGCEVVCYETASEALSIIENRCKELNTPLHISKFDNLNCLSRSLKSQSFSYEGARYSISLLGKHQCKNASVVIDAVKVLRSRGWTISDEALRFGLRDAKWPARFEILSLKPIFILDGGHNPQCASSIAQAISDYLPDQKLRLIIGMLADKNVSDVVDILAPNVSDFYCLTPDSDRAMPADELAALIMSKGLSAKSYSSSEECLSELLESVSEQAIMAFGSLYLAGELRESAAKLLQKKQRKEALAARNSLSKDYIEVASIAICKKLISSDEFQNSKKIFVYKAVAGEVRLDYLINKATALGKEIYYPLCKGEGEMLALKPEADTVWLRGSFGISEPSEAGSGEAKPSELDLIICPLVAFDKNGNRIGMGGGYYDRFLAKAKSADVIGVAFDCQKVKRILAQTHDVPLTKVITEK